MNSPLFSAFPSTNKDSWKQQAIKDLKGKDFETHLLWNTAEGIVVQPYYAAEDLMDERLETLQAVQQKSLGWANQCVVVYENEKNADAEMKAALQKGAEALLIDLGKTDAKEIEFSKLFIGIKLSDTPVYIQTNGQEVSVISALKKFIPYQMKGGLMDDGLAHWMQTGQLSEVYFEDLANVVTNTQDSPQFRVVCVSSHLFHNAGANAVQELAFTLASAVTYIDKLTNLGLTPQDVMAKLYFSVSVGTNYFMEIAKLRALRYLWSVLQEQWSVANRSCFIQVQTSTFYDAAIDPNTNMLRATTEAMSAVMGGCDVLNVHAFDAVLKTPDDFSARIARNVSTILKEESYLDKSVDPAAGSYYLENLTLQLIDTAWALFLEVEKKGGLMPAFEQNFIQDQIESNYDLQLKDLQLSNKVMVGVNKFQLEGEKLNLISDQNAERNTSLKLLSDKRIAQFFEKHLHL